MEIGRNKKRKKLSTKVKVLIAVPTAVVIAVTIGVFMFLSFYHEYEEKIVKPTCTANGYTQLECKYCHEIVRKNYTAALGHEYSDYKTTKQASELSFGSMTKECSRCHDKQIMTIEPTINMKKIYLNGDAYTLDNDNTANCKGVYSYDGQSITKDVTVKYIDGNNTRYAKHDLIITFYADDALTEETKVSMMDGISSASWRLFGDYYDYGNARNASASELFRQIRATDKCDNDLFKDGYGIPDSEPALLYVNNAFSGVYRIVETPDKQCFNMHDEATQAIIRANTFTSQTKFLQTVDDSTEDWEVVYSYDEQTDWVYNSLNNLIDFVSTNDDKAFKEGISQFLDVDGMIDYMLTAYLTAAGSNTAKNFTLATYDGKHWTPSFYDLNLTFGLSSSTKITNLEDTLTPTRKDGKIDDSTSSELWSKMINNFYPEIKAKYNALKSNIYTISNVTSIFDNEIGKIKSSALLKDKQLYPRVETDFDLHTQLADFVTSRRNIFDEFFGD